MKNFTVSLSLSAEQLQRFYAGQVSEVWAHDVTGVSLRFPLASLRPFIGHAGIEGHFRLRVSREHKLMGIDRLV